MSMKISGKLFTVTALFFVFLILALIVFQTLTFESYYETKKIKNFKAGFDEIYDQYLKAGMPDKDKPNYFSAFEGRSNAKTAIVTATDTTIKVTMLTNPGQEIFYVESIDKADMQTKIQANKKLFKPSLPPLPGVAPGKVSASGDLMSAIQEFFPLSDGDSPITSSISTEPFVKSSNTDGTNNLVGAVLLSDSGSEKTYLFAVSSLQPIGEAMSVIKELYLYFLIFAILVVLLLAFIFSNMVSKPLVRINNAAMKMAGLDFSVKCEEKSRDEIGSLANTLNFLSVNLYNALNDLKAANSQLMQDIEKERQLEKMRKEFVAGVSHELKTPVSLIMGYAEGLKENLVDGEDRERYIGVISDETQKMGNLINDMLDLSQLESGKFKLDRQEFIIGELLEHVIRKFEPCFSEKYLKTELCLPDEKIYVFADEFRIEQVINNFLNNAIRHTPENGVIRVGAVRTDAKVRIEIENTGSHIDEKDLENIWLKFYKAEKSRSRDVAGAGTGLGLAIVRNILSLHGSGHGAENTADGVRFFFELEMCS